MASPSFMPFYVADYLSDAAHLTTIEHGAYLMLIMNYWQRGEALPSDNRKLARIARCTDAEWADMRDTIAEFFTEDGARWLHGRIDAEFANANDKIGKAKAAGLASAEARRRPRSTRVEPTLNGRSTDVQPLDKTRGEEIREESKSNGAPGARDGQAYAFSGSTIRLTRPDFDKWRSTFHAIGDLNAELAAIDGWFSGPKGAAKRKDWFSAVPGMLAKKHGEALAASKPPDPKRSRRVPEPWETAPAL